MGVSRPPSADWGVAEGGTQRLAAGTLSLGTLTGRALWIALRLWLVIWLAEPGRTFLYQGF